GSITLPNETPQESTLLYIAREQSTALMTQLEAVENFVDEYGIYTAGAIINTFGIYNFARHDAEKLIAQEEAWRLGKPINTVVVDARSDWNSFKGNDFHIEDLDYEGMFFFEANSGADTARIAVTAGQHERSQGREPAVEKFIVHGHGAPGLIVMGVNREAIDIKSYTEAAQKASTIHASEVNDYKKHLGPDFEVILQSCSTAGEALEGKNIADIISERHDVRVIASNSAVYGLRILEDGSVKFETNEADHQQVVYESP
ncbi:MAG: hypothetical protein JWL89_210, partial [Candidatus Saccharibacteria bacterium]|nr:hypothetical protein [Candidatus Saccharibacteria bacterium]